MKVKLVTVEESSLREIKQQLNSLLEINNLQTFMPIFNDFMNIYNNSKTQFTFKTLFRIKEIKEKLQTKTNDYYIKHFFKCKLWNVSRKQEHDDTVFIKILPLLNVIHYLTGEYNTDNSFLPNKYYFNTLKKINNNNNSAYIDVFFSYLGSNLTEKGKCPTFPLFYGTYNGIKKDYTFDITEDYNDLKESQSFIHGVGFNYTLKDIEIEKNGFVNTDLLNSNCDIDFSEIVEQTNYIEESDIYNGIIGSYNNTSLKLSRENLDNLEPIELENPIKRGLNGSLYGESEIDKGTESTSDSPCDSILSLDSMSKLNKMPNKIHFTEADLSNIRLLNNTETLSDISASTNKSNVMKCVNIPEFPVQLNCIESLSKTLDNYLDNSIEKKICPQEWKSILFQICFGLAVSQKEYIFVHNDLHSSNIMFKDTHQSFIYFSVYDKFYKIPTFNKITKIIDFGRATFKVNNNIYFSDVFKKNEDAAGQYSYPYGNSLKHCKIKPNKSFDLARLATTIIHRFETMDESYNDIKELIMTWITDKYGNCLIHHEEDFQLYKTIAKTVLSAVPKTQLLKKIWNDFIIEKQDIPPDTHIYKYM